MTETRSLPDTARSGTDPGDHDRFAHYIAGRDPRAKITKAVVEGTPLRALCGKRWIPSRDPTRYPVCPDCRAIKDRLLGRSPAPG